MKILSPVLILFFVFCAQTVHAEPMFIEFTKMMEQAQTIVIADYLGFANPNEVIKGQYRLLVRQILKGKAKLDTIIVSRAHGSVEYDLSPNTSCVAFLNGQNEFEWVATTKGKSLEEDLLFLRGFYDYNAYMVAPSGITIGQLKEYINKGHYGFAAEGKLHFYEPENQEFQPSDIAFKVKGQYPNGKKEIDLKGLDLGDFSKLTPNFNMPGGNGMFSLVYESNMVRPLKFMGQLQEFDKKNNKYKAMFWVTNPEEMTKELFDEFMTNPQYGHPYYKIEIKTKKGKNYLFTYHEKRGNIGELKGYDDGLWTCSSLGDPSETGTADMTFGYYKKEKLIIRINKLDALVKYYSYPYRQDRLIRTLRVKPLNGQVLLQNKDGVEEKLDDCTISLKATKWAPNVNYKK